MLDMLQNGTPNLMLVDKAGKPRMALGMRSDGSSTLGLFDQNGQHRIALDVDAKQADEPQLNLYDAKRTRGIHAWVNKKEGAGVIVFDGEVKVSDAIMAGPEK